MRDTKVRSVFRKNFIRSVLFPTLFTLELLIDVNHTFSLFLIFNLFLILRKKRLRTFFLYSRFLTKLRHKSFSTFASANIHKVLMFSSFRFCLKILSFVKKDEKKKGMNEIVERASELVERASEELHFATKMRG